MKYLSWLAVAAILTSCSTAQQSSEITLNNESDSLSYAIGVSMGESLNQQPLGDINIAAIQAGIEKQVEGTNDWDLNEIDQFIRKVMNAKAEEEQRKAEEEGIKFLEENKTKEGVVTTESGLQYLILEEGTGATPDANDKVTFHYTGTLIDGTVFDSSVEKGQPLTYPCNGLIPGWTEGLQLMKEGGKRKFFIPSNLGYGSRGSGSIPPNSALIFEVELISVDPVE